MCRSTADSGLSPCSRAGLPGGGYVQDGQRRTLAAYAQPVQADSSEEEVKQPQSQQLSAVQSSIGFIGAGQVVLLLCISAEKHLWY